MAHLDVRINADEPATAKKKSDRRYALAFGVIVVPLIGGSLWIIHHLNQNMASMLR